MFGRPLRSQLDLLQPDMHAKVQRRQERQKFDHNQHSRSQEFKCGDLFHVRNFSQGSKWVPGVVVQIRGPVSYTVKLANGEQKCIHVDHLCLRVKSNTEQEPDWADTRDTATPKAPQQGAASSDDSDGHNYPPLRRSTRNRQPPERYGTNLY